MLRDEESITFPILLDELSGKVHRRYGSLPNPTYIIDRSGRIAFRSFSSRPDAVREALEELLERQQKRNVDHAVVPAARTEAGRPQQLAACLPSPGARGRTLDARLPAGAWGSRKAGADGQSRGLSGDGTSAG